MDKKKRKPNHPGVILDELYIKPLNLNLTEFAEILGISRNALFKIRATKASISPKIAVRLSLALETTPNLWLNLQQKYDIWIEENEKECKLIQPISRYKNSIRCGRNKSATSAI